MAQYSGPRYRITIIARRKRLLDQSNLCVKFAEDALKGRIIPDDSPKYIEELIVRQELVSKGGLPETIIEVEVIGQDELF
jgi:hypothetical protein